jgi:YesN/AraC family two-component response regulator
VHCAVDGVEASRMLAQQAFDVVLTDMLMPSKDGVELIGELRTKYPATRIIAMSGGGHIHSDQYLKIAQKLGAHASISKPFTREALLAVLTPEPAA